MHSPDHRNAIERATVGVHDEAVYVGPRLCMTHGRRTWCRRVGRSSDRCAERGGEADRFEYQVPAPSLGKSKRCGWDISKIRAIFSKC
jgi:hypothetical protein